ncbi:MAG: hypothetical protein ACREQN_04135 [Candidatus Binataceae bacterium]
MDWWVRVRATPAILLTVLAALALAGCTNAALSAAQRDIAAKQYAPAHQQLMVAARNPSRLSMRERREVADGLCLTEFKLGAPGYPVAEQYQACTQAARQTGSGSAPILAEVEVAQHANSTARVNNALKAGDVSRAEAAVVEYQSMPGGDRQLVAHWSRQIWALVNKRESDGRARRGVAPAISEMARAHPHERAMGESAFKHWIVENATVAGTRLVSGVKVRRNTVELWVPNDQLAAVALNMDRFTQINDALVARCHCDGRTNVAFEGSGLPAYLLRLDPETRQSEVLMLSQP